MMVLQILVFALSLAMLYSLPSDLVCMYTPSVKVSKACLRRGEEKMPKSVRARTCCPLTDWLPSCHCGKI